VKIPHSFTRSVSRRVGRSYRIKSCRKVTFDFNNSKQLAPARESLQRMNVSRYSNHDQNTLIARRINTRLSQPLEQCRAYHVTSPRWRWPKKIYISPVTLARSRIKRLSSTVHSVREFSTFPREILSLLERYVILSSSNLVATWKQFFFSYSEFRKILPRVFALKL